MRRPPRDAKCDASNGAHYDQMGAPVISRCREPATVTRLDPLGHEVWLCAEHDEALEEKGRVTSG